MTSISKEVALKFCELCNSAYEAWITHRELFEDNPDDNANIRKFPYLFQRLSAITQEYVLQQISKLHESARGKRKDLFNLTIDYMVVFGNWGEEKSKILELQSKLKELGNILYGARNKLLAHNDLETILQGKPLGSFPEGKDIEYFNMLQAFVNEVHNKWIGGLYIFNDLAKVDVKEFLQFIANANIRNQIDFLIAKGCQNTVSLQEALELLGLKGGPARGADNRIILYSINRLISIYGMEWVKANRDNLVKMLGINNN